MADMNYDPRAEKPPAPGNFKIDITYWAGDFYFAAQQQSTLLSCTKCDDYLPIDQVPGNVDILSEDGIRYAGEIVTRHNATRHPELLKIKTEAGWIALEYLRETDNR